MILSTEYGVWRNGTNSLWRGPWDREEAEAWIKEWLDDGGRDGAFEVVKIEVSRVDTLT